VIYCRASTERNQLVSVNWWCIWWKSYQQSKYWFWRCYRCWMYKEMKWALTRTVLMV